MYLQGCGREKDPLYTTYRAIKNLSDLFSVPSRKVSLSAPRRLAEDDDNVEVECTSLPSNPPTKLTFLLMNNNPDADRERVVELPEDDQDLRRYHGDLVQERIREKIYDVYSGGYVSRDRIVLKGRAVRRSSGGIRVKCLGEYGEGDEMTDETVINGGFAPRDVRIAGPGKVSSKSSATFACRSGPSRPASTISWRVFPAANNRLLENGGNEADIIPAAQDAEQFRTEEGIEVRANLTLGPGDFHEDAPDLVIECRVSHPSLQGDSITYTHLLEVLCKSSLLRIKTGIQRWARVWFDAGG